MSAENGTTASEGTETYAIGISFGNSYSSIAHINREGKVEVIANEEGDRQIPTVLSYVEGEELHGTQAKAQLVRNPKNTIAYFRDYLGKKYSGIDPRPCRGSASPGEDGSNVTFEVKEEAEGDAKKITVSEATTRHIRRLKGSAGDFVGKDITSAVVTIPTDFTEEQKAALTKAAADANIQILQFIPEPISAVLAYDARSTDTPADQIIVVADFGGLRSDVAVVASRGGMYSILATAHDYELGGSQLDQVLMDHFAKEFEKKNKSDPRKNERSLSKLKLESEAVKKALSQSASATFSVESLDNGADSRQSINRTRYEILASKVFTRFSQLVEEVVRKADLDVLDVDTVIMSGGTSHTPRIASNISNLFSESTTIHSPATSTTALSPSELAARGAAVQASLIQEFDKEDIEQSTHEMVTVTPHMRSAIGVQLTGQKSTAFTTIIPPATAVPARKSATLTAPSDGDILIRIVEGERNIKVSKPEPKAKTNGASKVEDDDEEDLDSEEDDDEDEETREKEWKATTPLAELVLKGVKKNAKIEITVNVGNDLAVGVTAREVGGKGGVRGALKAGAVQENGAA